MTKDEWNNHLDYEISRLDHKYQRQRNKLISKRNQYK